MSKILIYLNSSTWRSTLSLSQSVHLFFSAENHGLRLEGNHCFTRSCELLQCEVETTLKLKESCYLQKVETLSYAHQDGKSRKTVYIIYESNTHQEHVWIIASNIVQALMAVVQELTGNGKLWDRHSILPNHPSKDALRDAMKCLL